MAELQTAQRPLRLGEKVPVEQIEMDTFEPSKGDFGRFRMADQVKNGRWTILFFYPADFTFV